MGSHSVRRRGRPEYVGIADDSPVSLASLANAGDSDRAFASVNEEDTVIAAAQAEIASGWPESPHITSAAREITVDECRI